MAWRIKNYGLRGEKDVTKLRVKWKNEEVDGESAPTGAQKSGSFLYTFAGGDTWDTIITAIEVKVDADEGMQT